MRRGGGKQQDAIAAWLTRPAARAAARRVGSPAAAEGVDLRPTPSPLRRKDLSPPRAAAARDMPLVVQVSALQRELKAECARSAREKALLEAETVKAVKQTQAEGEQHNEHLALALQWERQRAHRASADLSATIHEMGRLGSDP